MKLNCYRIHDSAASLTSAIWVLMVAVVLLAMPALAAEYLSLDNEFGISRDLSNITLSGSTLASARLFVDTVKNASPSEQPELQQVIADSLSGKIQVVPTKSEANYSLLIVLQRHRYGLLNPRREPAHGSVGISICAVPIRDAESDCGTLNYYYFRDYEAASILNRVLAMWTATVLQVSKD